MFFLTGRFIFVIWRLRIAGVTSVWLLIWWVRRVGRFSWSCSARRLMFVLSGFFRRGSTFVTAGFFGWIVAFRGIFGYVFFGDFRLRGWSTYFLGMWCFCFVINYWVFVIVFFLDVGNSVLGYFFMECFCLGWRCIDMFFMCRG